MDRKGCRMTLTVGIVGAGVVGRLLALKGHAFGWNVTLFEGGNSDGTSACSTVAPAMLAPYCELDTAERSIANLGADSPELWQKLLKQFDLRVFLQREGSLVVSLPQDREELVRFKRNITAKTNAGIFNNVSGNTLAALEPELDRRFSEGLYFPYEGQIDSRGLMKAMLDALQSLSITCYFGRYVDKLAPREIHCGTEIHHYDIVLDCRGYSAAGDIPGLRAVRGELIHIHAPDVRLSRPVRLMHPRYPLYIVPRPQDHYIIGATSIESDDASPISVRSTLELLSAAYSVNAGFSEARVIETVVGLRPAFSDNHPRIMPEPGLIRVNGMYRHGFLLAPKITDTVCQFIETGRSAPEHREFFREVA